jgi:hypothetical protein
VAKIENLKSTALELARSKYFSRAFSDENSHCNSEK